jgi:hypothetical protein
VRRFNHEYDVSLLLSTYPVLVARTVPVTGERSFAKQDKRMPEAILNFFPISSNHFFADDLASRRRKYRRASLTAPPVPTPSVYTTVRTDALNRSYHTPLGLGGEVQ